VQSAAPGITINLFKVRNFLFFVAVLAMHFIVLRPTPADMLFMVVLFFTVILNPTIDGKALIYFMLTMIWFVCIYISSVHVLDNPDVQFQLLSHAFVVLLGLTGCLTAMSWGEGNFHTFMKVYLAACCLAAFLGILGFVGGVDPFVWDGRAKALFPEPIVFGGFLLPGVLAGIYFLSRREGLIFPLAALALCTIGVLLSFSRADIFSLVICAPLYYLVLHRAKLGRAIIFLLIAIVIIAAATTISLVSFEGFQAKVMDRMSVAKEYDLGHMGRYNRYLLAVPIILENPMGLGIDEIEKFFPEHVHNLFIGSFLDYGWLAGVVLILLTVLSFKVALENQRATRSPMSMWLALSLFSQLPCALLQQVEHWRHMWLFLGLLWGFKVRNFLGAVTPMARDWVAPSQKPMAQF
jgi:hypothetical protein